MSIKGLSCRDEGVAEPLTRAGAARTTTPDERKAF